MVPLPYSDGYLPATAAHKQLPAGDGADQQGPAIGRQAIAPAVLFHQRLFSYIENYNPRPGPLNTDPPRRTDHCRPAWYTLASLQGL